MFVPIVKITHTYFIVVRRSSELLDYDKLSGEIPLQAFQLANGKNQNVFPRQISSKRR